MDTYKVKWTQLQTEIFRFFCIKAGQNLNQRGIAKALKKSPTAIANAIKGLEKEGILNVEKHKEMNLVSIEFNRDNKRAVELKRVENLKLIYESNIVKFLHNEFPGSTIILFGSYSLGEDVITKESKSDLDIAIIGSKEKEINLSSFEKKLERIIILNFYPSFKEIHKNLKNNILNGIVLSGSIEL